MRRIVAVVALAIEVSARVAATRVRLNAITARTSQAAFAVNFPEGRWARAEFFRSAWACSMIVEGVGAGRSGLAAGAELVVLVQSDRAEARRRGIARDVELGRTPEKAEAFWDEWMRAEEPFLANDQPWTRASLVVNGTPPTAMQAHTFVAPGPLNA